MNYNNENVYQCNTHALFSNFKNKSNRAPAVSTLAYNVLCVTTVQNFFVKFFIGREDVYSSRNCVIVVTLKI